MFRVILGTYTKKVGEVYLKFRSRQWSSFSQTVGPEQGGTEASGLSPKSSLELPLEEVAPLGSKGGPGQRPPRVCWCRTRRMEQTPASQLLAGVSDLYLGPGGPWMSRVQVSSEGSMTSGPRRMSHGCFPLVGVGERWPGGVLMAGVWGLSRGEGVKLLGSAGLGGRPLLRAPVCSEPRKRSAGGPTGWAGSGQVRQEVRDNSLPCRAPARFQDLGARDGNAHVQTSWGPPPRPPSRRSQGSL